MAFHQCEFYNTYSSSHFIWTSCHNQNRWMAFHQCESLRCHDACHDGAEVSASGLKIGRSPVQISPKTNFSIMIKFYQLNSWEVKPRRIRPWNSWLLAGIKYLYFTFLYFTVYEIRYTLKLFPQSGQANSFSPVWIQIATICEHLVAVRTNEWLTIERHSRPNNDKYLTMIRTQGRPQATWCPRQSSLVTWAVMCEKYG